jgi:hypothetical protein
MRIIDAFWVKNKNYYNGTKSPLLLLHKTLRIVIYVSGIAVKAIEKQCRDHL